jgi:hypothetical protein
MISVVKKIQRMNAKPKDVALIRADGLVYWPTYIRMAQ